MTIPFGFQLVILTITVCIFVVSIILGLWLYESKKSKTKFNG